MFFKNSNTLKFFLLVLSIAVIALAGFGCGNDNGYSGADGLEGTIKIDGSSTVFPITEAVAEEFQNTNPGVRVTVGLSGTGGGFKKFTTGETDITNASRHIKDEEIKTAEKNSIEYIELKVAFDGLSVVVNPQNNFVDDLTVEELKKIWEPGSKVKIWKDIRPEWPAERIRLFGPGTDSGTFDYFTEEIVGKSGASRPDYTASEDDNVLVQGIAGDKNSLGYFGYAYYAENKDKVKLVSVNGVLPTVETVKDGSYSPLSRPMFIYANKESLEKPEVFEFIKFYMENGNELASDVGYVPLPDKEYEDNLKSIE